MALEVGAVEVGGVGLSAAMVMGIATVGSPWGPFWDETLGRLATPRTWSCCLTLSNVELLLDSGNAGRDAARSGRCCCRSFGCEETSTASDVDVLAVVAIVVLVVVVVLFAMAS